MSDVALIVRPSLVDGFRLAGARVWGAPDAGAARELLAGILDDPEAGVVGIDEDLYAALDTRTLRAIEQRSRPVVVPLPTHVVPRPEERRRAYVVELIRRAVGLKVVLGSGR